MGPIPPREKEDFTPTLGSQGNGREFNTNFNHTTVSTDERSYQSKILTSNMTGSEVELAEVKKTGRKLYKKCVIAEQKAKVLRRMSERGVGINRVEDNQLKSRMELSKDTGRRVIDIANEMERKAKDAEKAARKARSQRNLWIRSLEEDPNVSKNRVK